MTTKEAIKILERLQEPEAWEPQISEDAYTALEMAIKAMEKQIPMKMPGTYTDYKCAVCGRRIRSGKGSSSFGRDNFCQRCGQAVDWTEDES